VAAGLSVLLHPAATVIATRNGVIERWLRMDAA
jgi:hypothetical protein